MKDGGQAFPSEIGYGMTLRDWFAGQALVGWMANAEVRGTDSEAADACYKLADAMLSAKEGEDDPTNPVA